jgi:hypothetical protein
MLQLLRTHSTLGDYKVNTVSNVKMDVCLKWIAGQIAIYPLGYHLLWVVTNIPDKCLVLPQYTCCPLCG